MKTETTGSNQRIIYIHVKGAICFVDMKATISVLHLERENKFAGIV